MTSKRLGGCAAAFAFVLGACGGAGSGTTSNSGGTSSGGAGATGGTSTGGSGGTSATGGSGGSGAIGGGGATGGSGGSLGALCAKLEPLTCFGGDCAKEVEATLAQGVAAGCEAQLQAAIECVYGDTPYCDEQVLGVQYTNCQPAIDSYNVCLQGAGQCTQGGFIGPCFVLCGSDWGAECSLKDGETSWFCFCRVGPHVGTTFNVPPEQKCSETVMAEKCGP